MTNTPAWDGRPNNPERDSVNWLEDVDGYGCVWEWNATRQAWNDDRVWIAAEIVVARGWNYGGPALNPSELAALVREAKEDGAIEGFEAAIKHISSPLEIEAHYGASPEVKSLRVVLSRRRAELARQRAEAGK